MLDGFKEKFSHNPVFHAVLLAGFALISAALLILGDLATRDAIKERRIEDLKRSLAQVIPPEMHDNDLLHDTTILDPGGVVYRGRKKGQVEAVAYEVDARGYSGLIRLLIGVDKEGRVLGVRILSHTETPGLGDKIDARKSDWIRGFNGLSLKEPAPDEWKVKKDGGYFDQFSGATITPRAVVKAVKQGLVFFADRRDELLGEIK